MVVLAVTLASGAAIWISESDYIDLQNASGAADFVGHLDAPGRTLLAAGFDIVFSVAYAALGVVGFRTHGAGSRLAAWGAGFLVAGAVSDEIENGFVVANVVRRDTLTDGWVDAMQVPGTTKWMIVPGFLLLLWFIATRSRRDATPAPG